MLVAAVVTAVLVSNKPVDNSHELEIAKLNKTIESYYDSLRQSERKLDTIVIVLKSKDKEAKNLVKSLEKTEKELKQVKGSLKNLTNNELVTEANQEYGGSDTTELTILLSRPTTEFLIESAKETKILASALEFSKSLNRNYSEQITLQQSAIKELTDDRNDFRAIIELKDDHIEIQTDAYKSLSRKFERRKKLEKGLIIVIGGLIIYSAVK